MHKSRLGTVIFDCQEGDLNDHALFWGRALGGAPSPAAEQRDPRFVRLDGNPGEARVLVQRVDHPSRVHIDIETDDIDAEVERLVGIGAMVVERMERWVVLEALFGWDGKVDGKNVVQGSYLYQYTFSDREQQEKNYLGSVHLIR